MNAAQVAAGIKAAIEALTPTDAASPDDLFRITIGFDSTQQSGRVGILTINGGIKAPGRTNRCDTWRTSADLVMFYADLPAEHGQDTALQRAVADAELIAQAVYDWAYSTAEIERVDLDEAAPMDGGDGQIMITRPIRLEYTRG